MQWSFYGIRIKNKKSKEKSKEKGDFKRKSGVAGLVIQSELVRRGKAALKTLKYDDDDMSGNQDRKSVV